MRLIILGPPGSGKGTISKLLSKKLKLKHLSLGDFLRKEYKQRTKLGLAAYPYWSKGQLVPDNMIIALAEKHLPKNNYLLDGYPRTVFEGKNLEKHQPTDLVIHLTCPKEIIIKRLLKRALIEGRKDDTLEIIKNRILIYHKKTTPVLTFYKKKLATINGNRTPALVTKNCLKALSQFKKIQS